MSDKIERYNKLLRDLNREISYIPCMLAEDEERMRINAINAIRQLRKYIERFRRIADDGQPNEDAEDARIYRMVDVWKLPKDVLAKVVWDFLSWHKSEDGNCPAKDCKDYPCWFKKQRKEELNENLASGHITREDYDKYINCIHKNICEGDCDDDGEGCWASYYAWCYLNGYNPLSGKKEAK